VKPDLLRELVEAVVGQLAQSEASRLSDEGERDLA
jgi:hypothetical protein